MNFVLSDWLRRALPIQKHARITIDGRGRRTALKQGGVVDTVVHYLEAIDEINRADEDLDRILECLSPSARTRPRQRMSTSERRETPGPAGQAIRDPDVADRSARGPAVDEIVKALARVHRAYAAAEVAWGSIEPKVRQQLASPPKRFPDR